MTRLSHRHAGRHAVLAVAAFVFAVACGHTKAPVADAQGGECPTTGQRACQQSSDCGPDIHCTGGRCFANQASCPCSDPGDCGGSAHCAKGVCYANEPGVPCSAASDCGARAHCTVGTCYANGAGAPCGANEECGPSSSCVNGTCN
jgi:hypothetical protein